MKMLSILLFLASSPCSLGADVTLSTVSYFTDFVSKVNSGSTYSEDTVYLDSDITLHESIDPIGNEAHQFLGVFDGQGHVVSNLTVNSSLQHVGLFGYSNGLTIKNVVLDRSCSITSTFTGSVQAYVGGIIGYCRPSNIESSIENNVNMADVTFSGSTSYSLWIGGIAGVLYSYSSSYNAYMKNCVNYGSVTDSGTVDRIYAALGGIVGDTAGTSSNSVYIQNCLNYGTITHSGTSTNLIIGGIVVYGSRYVCVENCVSVGKIATPTTAAGYNRIGSIMGWVGSPGISINYCYFTSDVNVSSINGYGTPESTLETLNFTVDVDLDFLSKLNSNATSCGWAKWFMLHLNGGSINSLAQEILVEIQGRIPDPVKEGNSFLYWCKDAERTDKFDPATDSIDKITALYAAWVNNTVTFNVSGGNDLPDDELTKTVTFDKEYGDLPEPNRTGYSFLEWLDENDKNVTSETIVEIPKNHVLYARWAANTYIVAFDGDGGGSIPASKPVAFDSAYGELPKPSRAGYAFAGWFTETPGGDPVSKSTTVTTAYDHTIYAHWTAIQYTISFDPKGGSACRNITQDYNTLLTFPKPERVGYAFVGWFDADLTVEYTTKTVQAENVTLCAKWEANTYTVSFDANGGNEPVNPKSVTFGSAYGELLAPSRTGHTFAGWADSPLNGNKVNNATTVRIPSNHTLYAQWTINQYAITFDFGGGKVTPTTQSYGAAVIYPNKIPSKLFHKFREWCTRDAVASSERCNVTHVPANDLTFTASFDVDSILLTGGSVAIVAMVLVIILLVIVLILMKVVRKTGEKYERIGVEMDEDMREDERAVSKSVEARILRQMGAIKISSNFAKTLKSSFKKVDENKGLNEIFADLGVERMDSESDDDDDDDVIESFRTNGAVHAAVASAAYKKKYLVAAAEYLRLLYMAVREQEKYEQFGELYFGMKDIDNLTKKMDEKTISFSGIVSGFTSREKAVQFLMLRDEKKEKRSNNTLNGVLFKVSNAKGYRIGKLDGKTDEVLFEINSEFKVEPVKEVTKDKFIVAALSFVSPISDNETVKLKSGK